MLKINIVCVGNIKEKFFNMACDEYIKRLGRFCNINVIEVKEQTEYENIEQIKSLEGKDILKYIKGFCVVMDIQGKNQDSTQFANFIQETSNNFSEISFVIGGSYGVCESVKNRADFKLSFSKMTFPHMLFRVMLLEQIYRAFTINNNIKYHK